MAACRQALERIGVGQRKDRRERGRCQRHHHEDGRKAGGEAEHAVAGCRKASRCHQEAAEGAKPVRQPGHQRHRNDAQQQRRRQNGADGLGIEPLCRQPDRQKRHLNTEGDENAGVEACKPRDERIGGICWF
jgi:hypothetical protein